MLMLVSPAKTLDFTSSMPQGAFTHPRFARDTRVLVERMRELAAPQLQSLMDISAELAALNTARFRNWRLRNAERVSRPAILAFRGEVYLGLRAETFSPPELQSAQDQLRILSGLYGLLRPLDLIQPYRLEMGTRLATERGVNLYAFWGDRIARALKADARAAGARTIVNLASQEYFHAIDIRALALPVVTPVFKENRGKEPKVISFSAKRARGQMAGFAIRNNIRDPEQLKHFSEDGYCYRPDLSSAQEWLFVREQPQSAAR